MQYMLLIYSDEDANDLSPEGMALWAAFNAEFADNIKAGDALQPAATATTVRTRDGKVLMTDGPFAETKEQLGGYYLVECENLDEALAMAAKVPLANQGSIEVRPLIDWENLPST